MSYLEPIKSQSTTQKVLLTLREAIYTQKLKAGQRIAQNELAKQLNVSITPVREALMTLENEQLVKIEPHKETIILGVTQKYIQDYYQARSVLESYLVADICNRKLDLALIEEAFKDMEDIIDKREFHKYGDANIAFHRAIQVTADNHFIANLLSQIHISKSNARDDSLEKYDLQSFKEHQAIMKYLRLYDAKNASKEMGNHLLRSMNDMLTYFAE